MFSRDDDRCHRGTLQPTPQIPKTILGINCAHPRDAICQIVKKNGVFEQHYLYMFFQVILHYLKNVPCYFNNKTLFKMSIVTAQSGKNLTFNSKLYIAIFCKFKPSILLFSYYFYLISVCIICPQILIISCVCFYIDFSYPILLAGSTVLARSSLQFFSM